MSEVKKTSPARSRGRVHLMRALIILPMMVVVAVSYWFVLPFFQSLGLPEVPGGESGPWLVRPIVAVRYGAAAILTAVTFPFVLRPLRKDWAAEDATDGIQSDPLHGQAVKRVGLMIKGSLLLAVYALAFVMYLYSWAAIGPDGVEERLPWTTIHHSFQDVAALETIPDGERSESLLQNGPWFSIKFKGGRSLTLSPDNEGITSAELSAMTAFIAERAELPWVRRKDSLPR